MKGLYGFLHRLLVYPFRFIFNIKVKGRENEPVAGGGLLVCSNHMSGWDPIWIAAALMHRQPHFMAKAELFKIPLLRGLIRALGVYPVNRKGVDVASIKTTISLLKTGKCVGMFPQGTRIRDVNPLDTQVKSGAGMLAVRAGVSVLPVYIGTKKFNSGAFKRKNIIIGKPIPFSVIEKMHGGQIEYAGISRYIFEEICALGGLKKTTVESPKASDTQKPQDTQGENKCP